MGSHPRRTRAATPESCPLPSEDARWVPGPRRWAYGGLPAHAWGQWREARPAVGDTRCPQAGQAGRAARAHGGGEAPTPLRPARRGGGRRGALPPAHGSRGEGHGAARGSARRDTKLPQSGSVRFRAAGPTPGELTGAPLTCAQTPAGPPRAAAPLAGSGRPRRRPVRAARLPAPSRPAPPSAPPRTALRPRLEHSGRDAAGPRRAGPRRALSSSPAPGLGLPDGAGGSAWPGPHPDWTRLQSLGAGGGRGGLGAAARAGAPPSPAALSPGPALRAAPGPPRPARREPPDAPPAAGPSAR